MRKRLASSSLILLAIVSSATLASAQTADEIIEKHLAALGGRDALSKLSSRRVTGTITVGTPNGDLSGPVEFDSKAPNKARAHFSLDLSSLGAGMLTVERKFDGLKGWTLDSMQGDSEITGNQLDSMKAAVYPTPLLNYKALGMTVVVMPRQQLNGKNAFVLKITPKTAPAVTLLIDPDTYLPMRTSTTLNVPELGGDVEQATELSDFRTVDGVKEAFAIKIINPAQTSIVKVTKIEHNVAFPDSLFIK
jgi:outer membrane lipoprotein-sorting protein